MGVVVSDSGSRFEVAPEGTHPARCTRVVDLGTQDSPFGTRRQVLLTWELLGEERMADGRPFVVNQSYTLSLNEKANLRKLLDSWRGRAFTHEELQGWDLDNVLGAPCLINLVHHENAQGRVRAVVSSAMKAPKGTVVPEPEGELVSFSISDWDDAVFEKLHEFWQDRIWESHEGRQRAAGPAGTAKPPAEAEADFDDDIPF